MLTHEILVKWLVGLGSHLNSTVHQVHLVDEQVTEYSGTRYNNIDTWASKLLKRNQFNLIHTSKRVRDGSYSNKSKHLCERFSVGLDVISSPKGECNRLGEFSSVIDLELFQKLSYNSLRYLNGCSGRDGRRIQGVHVTSGRKNIGVTDRVSTWCRHQELSVQQLHDSSELVIGNNLLQDELKVCDKRGKTLLLYIGKSSIDDSLGPWLLLSKHTSEEASKLVKSILDLLDTST
mmetsp:Transcript_24794/g.37898  ORF Transcript_24794/g.37898 Transcript_24794/m.37898 type:complete len:234 (+) Transcript_24794:883-1584(+)